MKTKQELFLELSRLYLAINDARKFYHNKGTFIDLETRIKKVIDALIEQGVTQEEINNYKKLV